MFHFGLFGQCPGSDPCPPGFSNDFFERLDISQISDAFLCSGQVNTVDVGVVPGSDDEAFTGDQEYVTLYFDFDCDGVFEYSVNDFCSYVNPGGCTVSLSVTAPTVTVPTTFNGRAHVIFETPISDPCAGFTFGDIKDFTITVNPPHTAVLNSSDADNIICQDESITFTASGADNYEFFVNGSSAQALSTTNTFTTSSLSNGDSVTVEVLDTTDGCNVLSAPIVTTVLNPSIVTQPLDQNVLNGDNALFSVFASETDTYQWQVSTDGGTTFNNILDGVGYSGTSTTNLTVNSANVDQNNYQFRALANNSLVSCPDRSSIPATLIVRMRTVMTNRRITYRVRKN